MIVSDFTALPAVSWANVIGLPKPVGTPVIITYSFPTSIPSGNMSTFPAAASTFSPVTEYEKQIARAAFNQWGQVSGLTFIEVPENFGDIRLQWIDFSKTQYSATFGGLGYFPSSEFFLSNGQIYPQTYDYWRTQNTYLDFGGEMFFNTAYRISGGDNGFLETLLHEIGHAIGMKHPFETSANNPDTLATALDNTSHTVMSYTRAVPNQRALVLGDFDIAAAQYFYGHANADGTQYESWSYNSATNIFSATAKADGGYTFGTGTNDVIQGSANIDYIATRGGNDIITPGLGDDRVGAGSGFDIVVYSGPRSSYTITNYNFYSSQVTGPDGSDYLVDVDRLQFADQFVNISPLGQVTTAIGGVLRLPFSDGTMTPAADSIAVGTQTLAAYVNSLIAQAENSTIPALIVPQFLEGTTPNSGRLDALAAFSAVQHAYYARMGVSNPDLGPYEALGMGFAETVQFSQKFGSLNDTLFITSSYNDAFGRAPNSAQVTHFQHQIDYFANLYIGVGVAADVAHVRARGAALGQILGFSAEEANNDYADAAKAFLLDASDGQVVYGTSLMSWLV